MDENLLQALWACSASCEYCADKCTEKGENPDTVRLLRDCSDLCMTGARFYTRGSVFTQALIEQCIHACSLCIEALKPMQTPFATECRESCSDCLPACQSLLQANDSQH